MGEGTRALAMTTDCTPRYVFADPYEGGKQAIAEAWRNLCAVGATPLAVTNCLNFGSPENPDVMWQFREAVHGLADGSAELYDETRQPAVWPSPWFDDAIAAEQLG